jgi:hypothetical protein
MASSGLEPTAFRLVAHSLEHLRYSVPLVILYQNFFFIYFDISAEHVVSER